MGPTIEPRRLHAAVAIVAACIVLIASAVAYLHPLLPWSRSAPQASPAASMAKPRTTPILASISFGDADHGAVTLLPPTGSYSSASTWLTADGGRTWQSFTALGSAPSVVIFDSPRHAIAEPSILTGQSAPGSSMVTEDSGRTWRPLPLPGQGRLTFLDAEHAWLLQPLGERPTGPPPVALWRTSDGGASWQHLTGLGAAEAGLEGPVLFADPQRGLLVAGTPGGGLVSLLATVDGGVSWQPVATFRSPVPGAYLWSTQVFVHGGQLLVAPLWVTDAEVERGSAGVRLGPHTVFHPSVSVSDDAGRTWSPLRAGPSVGSAFNGIVGLTLDDHGRLVMLDRGRLWVSEDSGTTWRARPATLPRGMETVGTITAAPGALFVEARADRLAPTNALLRSRDGGSHWSVVPLPKLAA